MSKTGYFGVSESMLGAVFVSGLSFGFELEVGLGTELGDRVRVRLGCLLPSYAK